MPGPAPEGCCWDAERNHERKVFVHADGTVYDKVAHRKAMRRKKRVEHQAAANAGDERANLILDRAAERSAKYQARVARAAADAECSRHHEATKILDNRARRERHRRLPQLEAARAERHARNANRLAAKAAPQAQVRSDGAALLAAKQVVQRCNRCLSQAPLDEAPGKRIASSVQ